MSDGHLSNARKMNIVDLLLTWMNIKYLYQAIKAISRSMHQFRTIYIKLKHIYDVKL